MLLTVRAGWKDGVAIEAEGEKENEMKEIGRLKRGTVRK